MTLVHDSRRLSKRGGPGAHGPALAFAVTVLFAFAALVPAAVVLPKDFALAAVASLFFAFAALVALIAWRLEHADSKMLSYWDVAGALTLFGICAATLMDSDQLMRLFETRHEAR